MKTIKLTIIILFCTMNIHSQFMSFVYNNHDSGEGSLRQVISDAKCGDTICFDFDLEDDTIKLNSEIVIDSISLVFNINKINITLSGQIQKRIMKITLKKGDSLEFNNINYVNGYSYQTGGAINCSFDSGAYVVFNNCNFNNNVAASGGAAFTHCRATNLENGGEIWFNNCNFLNNTVTGSSGVLNNEYKVNIFFNNCYFFNNTAYSGGLGHIHYAHFNDCRINSCNAVSYCSVFLGDNLSLNNSGFFNNKSPDNMMQLENTKINNCVFAGNKIGNFYLLINYKDVTIKNSVFTDNMKRIFSGLWETKIFNSLFFNNSNANVYNDDEYYFNCAYDQYQLSIGNPIKLLECPFNGTNNGMGNDSIWGTDDDDFSLNTNPGGGLLCINAGNNTYLPTDLTTDYTGNPRIYDGQVDIGAVEFMEHLSFNKEFNKEVAEKSISIYPNPAENSFTIQLPETDNITPLRIFIYSFTGIRIYEQYETSYNNIITIDYKLKKGNYLLLVQGEGVNFNEKLIIL